ncbi:MAG: hemolysin III family protein [Bacteroidetes bacterium]|nr:hemolysin III family protein [Bacteroidota bacterium]
MNKSEIRSELANALSHGFGILFSLIGTMILVAKTAPSGSEQLMFAVAFYGFSMMQMFTFSTLYHGFFEPTAKRTLRIFDHISIFFLIGGTYLPFVVKYTDSTTATWFLTIQWIIIAAGVIKKVFLTGKYRLLSSLIYIGIGCMVFFLGSGFWKAMPEKSIIWLIAGGGCYIVGVIFYQNKKIPANHFIWHLFVLASAIMHWFAVYFTF